jgi:hypothetical protein
MGRAVVRTRMSLEFSACGPANPGVNIFTDYFVAGGCAVILAFLGILFNGFDIYLSSSHFFLHSIFSF